MLPVSHLLRALSEGTFLEERQGEEEVIPLRQWFWREWWQIALKIIVSLHASSCVSLAPVPSSVLELKIVLQWSTSPASPTDPSRAFCKLPTLTLTWGLWCMSAACGHVLCSLCTVQLLFGASQSCHQSYQMDSLSLTHTCNCLITSSAALASCPRCLSSSATPAPDSR